MSTERIIFSRPFRTSRELANLETVLGSDHSHGDGAFTASATAKLKDITGAPHALLTTSCTHALELAALLLELGPDDEVIVPSFAFTSAATSMALRGATCVFVDIDEASGNIDPESVAAAITDRTKAVVVMHYGGVAADMDQLLALTEQHGIALIEDNAHGLGGTWRGRKLGTIGTLGTQSFHDTKNVHCGEGGALLLSDEILMGRAEIMREKGTNRARFLRGQVDKYSWQDIGSSYLPSELNAAVLDAQLDEFDAIQEQRFRVWNTYAAQLPEWAERTGARLMAVPEDREHTAHMFFIQLPTEASRDGLIRHLAQQGIVAPFHYIPLDSSPAGLKYGRTPAPCTRSAHFSATILRLPLWPMLTQAQLERVVEAISAYDC
ncbi:dTDP-4-amino-4,6-dideoxygalactose transaminase [Nocardia sp. NPDC051990]|uniref:dTDP-4-amino-4,6-dideoxygalactose transaminase n=1 Tax=Nocardia sp. NPDC051990 TaxID=3155285 RepID=UPI003445BA4B